MEWPRAREDQQYGKVTKTTKTEAIDAIVSCVQEVEAISVLPEHACRWEAYPGIKVIPLKGDRWRRSVGLITPQLAAPLPAVSCFVDFLRNTATEKTF